MEATVGFEPTNEAFAEPSLNHLGTSPSPFGEANVTRTEAAGRVPAPRSGERVRAPRNPGLDAGAFPPQAWRIFSASSRSTSMTQLIPEIAAASRVSAQRSSREM